LNKYRSTIPNSQGRQLLKTLEDKTSTGTIRNLDEFKAELQIQIAKLLQERIRPTFSLLKALEGRDISSDTFNEMIVKIQDDYINGIHPQLSSRLILSSPMTIISSFPSRSTE
jgi:hypothetical protein